MDYLFKRVRCQLMVNKFVYLFIYSLPSKNIHKTYRQSDRFVQFRKSDLRKSGIAIVSTGPCTPATKCTKNSYVDFVEFIARREGQ